VRLLVTGGAGYIGSVVTSQLLRAGHQVVVLDDLSTGHSDSFPEGAQWVQGRIQDARDVLMRNNFDGGAALRRQVFG
jgi:UDP-glucose 4-epimerase